MLLWAHCVVFTGLALGTDLSDVKCSSFFVRTMCSFEYADEQEVVTVVWTLNDLWKFWTCCSLLNSVSLFFILFFCDGAVCQVFLSKGYYSHRMMWHKSCVLLSKIDSSEVAGSKSSASTCKLASGLALVTRLSAWLQSFTPMLSVLMTSYHCVVSDRSAMRHSSGQLIACLVLVIDCSAVKIYSDWHSVSSVSIRLSVRSSFCRICECWWNCSCCR